MLDRHFKLVVKDPVTYLGRSFVFLLANIYFAVVYVKARERAQDQVLNRFWTIVWFICVPTQLSVVAVYSYSSEFNSVKKEIKNGMLNPLSFLIAKAILEIPIMFIFTLFALGIPAYAIIDYDAGNFFPFILIYAIQMYVWEAMAQAFATVHRNPLVGMMLIMFMWFSGFLYAGFLIAAEDMIWPFKIFYYILPMKYGIRSMGYLEYHDSTYKKCSSGSLCFGRDGPDVLDSIHEIFGTIDNKRTFGEDIGASLAVAFFFKALYVYLFLKESRRASTIVPRTSKK